MPSRRFSTTLAGGATSPNILESDWIRFPGRPAKLTIAAAVPVALVNDIELNVELGSDLIAKGLNVAVENSVGAGAQVPYNLLVEEGVAGSDQIIITYTSAAVGGVISTLVVLE